MTSNYLQKNEKELETLIHATTVDEKKTLRNNISGEPERYSRQNYVAETLSKE